MSTVDGSLHKDYGHNDDTESVLFLAIIWIFVLLLFITKTLSATIVEFFYPIILHLACLHLLSVNSYWGRVGSCFRHDFVVCNNTNIIIRLRRFKCPCGPSFGKALCNWIPISSYLCWSICVFPSDKSWRHVTSPSPPARRHPTDGIKATRNKKYRHVHT